MPAKKVIELCAELGVEKNPRKLLSLIEELIRALKDEQSALDTELIAKRLLHRTS